MESYFDASRSAEAAFGADPARVLSLLGHRFMRDNPETPFTWRAFDETGIRADRQARYHLDFGRRFPEAENGTVAFAAGDLLCPRARSSVFVAECDGPVQVWLNGEQVFRSSGAQERSHEKCPFPVSLREGRNRFVWRCENTAIGFGCRFANAMPQWEPCNFLLPWAEGAGGAGIFYSRPAGEEQLPDPEALFREEMPKALDWFPRPAKEMPGTEEVYAAWFRASRGAPYPGAAGVRAAADGAPGFPPPAAGEEHEYLLAGPWTRLREILRDPAWEGMEPPFPVSGAHTPYVLAGPLAGPDAPELSDCRPGQLIRGQAGTVTWRAGLENTAIRPYAESFLYGRWTYPLGVTLYGMGEAARKLEDDAMLRYVTGHIRQAVSVYDYACYDRDRYGFPGVDQQICWLDALDDCGSFASAMLELAGGDPASRRLADRIARYMLEEQPRTGDGAFRRRDDTVWADDMYMSGPFLCRYSRLSGDPAGLDTCAEQLLKYRELLFLPEKGLMAHMRCLRNGRNNGIPWSRGNGWVLFTLSELLRMMPPDHPRRGAVLDFYLELCRGVLRVQDAGGMWHQLLDEPGTYPESSATAMFICALGRGLRFGWIPEGMREEASRSVFRAWRGLCRAAVDREGNLYGVCRGSGFSFSRAYYRSLLWNLNDTHGIGIVMLAGTEIMNLAEAGGNGAAPPLP